MGKSARYFSSILKILVLNLTFWTISGSPIIPEETTPYPQNDDTPTTQIFEIIFRVEESDVNSTETVPVTDPQLTLPVTDPKLTPLPTDEVKDPVKEGIVVFRQSEEEQQEEDSEEEEEEEEPETAVASSTASPSVSPSSVAPETPEEEVQPAGIASEQTSKESTPVPVAPVPNPPENAPNQVSEPIPEEPNLGNFEGLSPAVPSEHEDVPEVVEDPSPAQPPAPPKPSIQSVQAGYVPVLEPGVFTSRPKPTESSLQPSSRPEPIGHEVTPGIPVEENPGIFEKRTPPPVQQAPSQPPREEVLPNPVVLPPASGKYKITKPKVPALPATVAKAPPSPTNPPLSISDEWNLTSSIFTLSPQGRAACECGKTPFKVDGSAKSGINEYPWTVAVVRSGIFGGGRPHCGGVLINSAYVLSSASCFETLYADSIQVWLTAHDNLQAIDNVIHSDRIIKRDVREILMHPNYDRRTHDNDIALLRLSSSVDISTSSYYVPACLPAGMSTYDGMTARVMGWGTPISASNRYAPNRMCKEDIPVISNQVCNRDTSHRNKITGNQMCAGFLAKQPAESCIGDAGGPLMLPNNGRFTLIGLVSHGFANRQAYTPVVYTRVGTYADWILHNTEDAEWCSL